MLYRKFGKTNEMVSTLGFGCMRLPVLEGDTTKIDEIKATEMIRHAIDNGVNYVDTAYPYHGTGMTNPGESEPFVGRALKDGYREKVKLATKLPSWLINSREDMDKYLNHQLERLQTSYIDFYLVHALEINTWEKLVKLGIKEFLDSALKDGRIKYAGFSFHDKEESFPKIVDSYDWTFCQIQYNYLDENFQAGKSGLDYAASKGLGIVIMEPLRGGKLAVNLPENITEIFDNSKVDRRPAGWALSWVLNHSEVAVILSGMGQMFELEDNLKVCGEIEPDSLKKDELEVLDKVKTTFRSGIKNNCTACGYCMPCPFGVNIPRNFAFYNDYHIFGDKEKTIASYNRFVKPSEKASNCAECGKCESHCPQAISIIEDLKKVEAIFEA